MGLDNLNTLSDDIQNDCAIIKKILLDMCEGKIPFKANEYSITLEYLNRDLIIKVDGEVVNTLPFEIIYFDLRKNHLDASKYEEAIRNLLIEELDKVSLQRYA